MYSETNRFDRRLFLPLVFLLVALSFSFLFYEYQGCLRENGWLRQELARYREEASLRDDQVQELQRSLSEIQVRLRLEQQRQLSSASLLRRPTMDELKAFLASDRTSNQTYQVGYVCMNYAADLKVNAARAGFNLSVIIINYVSEKSGGGGHVLNGAFLADGRWVWIEPQNDRVALSLEDHLRLFLRLPDVRVTEVAIVW